MHREISEGATFTSVAADTRAAWNAVLAKMRLVQPMAGLTEEEVEEALGGYAFTSIVER